MKHPQHLQHARNAAIAGIFASAVASASYALIDSDESSPHILDATATYPLAIPSVDAALPRLESATEDGASRDWLTHQVQRGETLGAIFAKYGLTRVELKNVLESGEPAHELKAIAPGHELKLRISDGGELNRLVYSQTPFESIEVERENGELTAKKAEKPVDRELTRASTTIHNSLFHDGKRVGLTDKLITQLAKVFEYDIDFALDLRDGDSFTVLYETAYVNGEQIGTSDILAAEFVNQGKAYQAFRYTDEQGRTDYYLANGQGRHKAFLRTPVEFTHISSLFSLARHHPILNTIRAHKGVDYAAPTGTSVRSTGNGRIAFLGTQSGYGNVVVVEHGQKYSTLYGHLSRFAKLKKGEAVRQGDVIGYVGQTGLATGPHLHYEFRIDGEHRDPLTVALPQSEPLQGRQLAAFQDLTRPFLAELERFRDVPVAQLD